MFLLPGNCTAVMQPMDQWYGANSIQLLRHVVCPRFVFAKLPACRSSDTITAWANPQPSGVIQV